MKNLIFGILCSGILVYTLMIGLTAYNITSRRSELNRSVSAVLCGYLEEYYEGNPLHEDSSLTEEDVSRAVSEELTLRLNTASAVRVEIDAIDLTSGILSAKVTEGFYLPTGSWKEISCKRTAIVERAEASKTVTVTYWNGGNMYKQYTLEAGSSLPVPVSPGNNFRGWKNASGVYVDLTNQTIEEDCDYYAGFYS